MQVLIQKKVQNIALIAQVEVIVIQVLHHVLNVQQENIPKKKHQYVMIVLQEHFNHQVHLLAIIVLQVIILIMQLLNAQYAEQELIHR